MKSSKLLSCATVFALALGCLGAAGQQAAPQASPDPQAVADQNLLTEIKTNNELMTNLEYLSDLLGPRVTGSERLTQANRWTMEKFRAYGFENARLEGWRIAHAWTRGSARARIVSPAEHPLTIGSAGWSPGTPGPVEGPAVYVGARRMEDLAAFKGKLKNAIVLTTEPGAPRPAYEAPRSPLLSAPAPPPPLPGQPAPALPFGPAMQRFVAARDEFFKAEGVAAVLRDSDKDHGLLNMTTVGGRDYKIGAVPTAFVSPEGYRLLWRLLKRGMVTVQIEMSNSFSDQPVEVYNTVAELTGGERPDEVVIIGAHLDSWDLGTGATDDGTGVVAVLEAARALKKLGLKPKRTIRFVLFAGEEQGLNGSRAYVEAHKSDLNKISGVLVHDSGTGRVQSIALHGNYQVREVMDRATVPLREVGLLELSMRRGFGTDHASFDDAGVPGFYCLQDPAEYRKTHHSQSDTFDKVWKDDLTQGAQVLAVWAYNVAQLAGMLPRRAGQPEQRADGAAQQ